MSTASFECKKDCEYPVFSGRTGVINKKFNKGEIYEMHESTRKAPEFIEVIEIDIEEDVSEDDGICEDCGRDHNSEEFTSAADALKALMDAIGELGTKEGEAKAMAAAAPKVQRPKYRVGDYVVAEGLNPTEYIKISCLQFHKGEYKYNQDVGGHYSEEALRKPTKEELAMYFR